jgi:hypothetical protein
MVEAKKLVVDFSEMNAPNPPVDPKLMFGVFCSFGFGRQTSCETRPRVPFWPLVERKNLQLIFWNERTQSSPFDPKLMFGVFSSFGFGRQTSCETRPRGQFWPR